MHCHVKQNNTNFACNWPPMCLLDDPTSRRREQPLVEENTRLSTVVARSRDYPSGNFSPKRKVTVQMQKMQTNVQICSLDLKGKWRIQSVNLRSTQLVFSCPFYRSSTLTSTSSTFHTLMFPRKKHTLIKRRAMVLKKIIWNKLRFYYRISVLLVHWS